MLTDKTLALLGTAILLALAGCAGGPSSDPGLSAASGSTQLFNPVNDPFRKGDTVIIVISGVTAPEAGTYTVTINEAGEITLPLIGALKAEGLNSVLLKDKIEQTYIDRRFFKSLNVSVTAPQERFINMTGEVRGARRLPYTKDMTALSAFAAVGGFTEFADRRRVKLLRDGKVIEFNALDLYADPKKDFQLQPNDQIHVERSIFY
jgi:polysaccharide export outer membrane protein